MNPAPGRIRKHSEFVEVCRAEKTSSAHLIIHYCPSSGPGVAFGFAVSKSGGGAVDRHRVIRRVRACCRELCSDLPSGSRVVLRARPSAGQASFWDLREEVEGAFLKIASEV